MQNNSIYPRRYAIIGTGAIGGFYGAKLQKSGLDVHFLLHNDYAYVKQHGLVIESVNGNFTLSQINSYQEVTEMPRCDVIIIALKTTQNAILPNLLPALLKEDSIILLLQNGLGIEPEIAKLVQNQQIVGGICFICSNKIAPGHIQHLDYGHMLIAEYARDYQAVGITKQLRAVADDFQQAGIKVQLSEDLLLARWQKLVWNIPFNGLSVVLNARTDELVTNPHARQLVAELMRQVILGARSCNRLISESFIQDRIAVTEKMRPYRTSMKLDFDSRRTMEIEAIFGNPLRLVQQAGIELPAITLLYQQLCFLNSRNCTN